MSSRTVIAVILLTSRALAAPPIERMTAEVALERRFTETVRPFIETYCIKCHGDDDPKGDFDLSPYSNVPAVVHGYGYWELVLEKLELAEMPPKKAKLHPTPELRHEVIDWIQAVRKNEGKKNAGDPGPVLARRLSNAEYDYTIRDLTGVDIRPTREFPVDPANQAGFDNSGESLAMSPALVKKYLQARANRGRASRPEAGRFRISRRIRWSPTPIATNGACCASSISTGASRRISRTISKPRGDIRHRARFEKAEASLADIAGEMQSQREIPGD